MSIQRIIFFGSGDFGLPLFEFLACSGHELTLVTLPPKKKGRGRKVSDCLLAQNARDKNVPVITRTSVRDGGFIASLKEAVPDLVLVVDFSLLIPSGITDWEVCPCINIHPSLLPAYRGASPIQSALLDGSSGTGVTIQVLHREMDAGDILLQERTAIGKDEYYPDLYRRLQEISVRLVKRYVSDPSSVEPSPQGKAGITYCGKFSREDYILDWNMEAGTIRNRLRAFYASGLKTLFRGKQLKVLKASPGTGMSAEPGSIVSCGKSSMSVAAGKGVLDLTEVQPVNKPRMAIRDFINGYRPAAGERFQDLTVNHEP